MTEQRTPAGHIIERAAPNLDPHFSTPDAVRKMLTLTHPERCGNNEKGPDKIGCGQIIRARWEAWWSPATHTEPEVFLHADCFAIFYRKVRAERCL